MKGIIHSVSALVLGVSSLAFTGAAQADRGLTIIYSNDGYGHRSYPVTHYYTHKSARYGRACAVKPGHRHYKRDYGYGHHKHDKHDRRHDKHAWRDHDRGYKDKHRGYRDHRSGKRDDSRGTHRGYARIDRY